MAQRHPAVPVTNPVVPWPTAEQGSSPTHEGEVVKVPETKDTVEKAKEKMRSGVDAAQRSLSRAERQVSDTGRSLLRTIRRFADEQPLRFAGVVAGAAFAVGVVLRIWRSSRYE